ncbi:hypothetical protein SKAU_G00426860 [Synaphobranchus kaupii]|uniref:Ig-like domain-containing protein n=1 Tax=Synaphobranchus kaupii TaxID=118154 RepID=A0A9Q1E4Y1_SYNKA|nr:hypothetical protein SKAU_G00426860 [Synaphobranchus kaupii]
MVDPSLWPSFLPGADVSVRCRVSRLVDSATLQWEKEGRPTADTKLFYNNAAHVIIHSVAQHSQGRYSCLLKQNGLILHSVSKTLSVKNVSAVLPDGPSRNQSVVLNCEISQVIGSVTLAWLWMRGGRGELVKQEVLREGHPNRMLNLTLLGLSEDQLHWACVVFTESMLRAQVPLHLMPLSAHARPGWSTETVVRVVIVVVATLGMLKVLLWYYRRRPQTEDTSTGTQQPSEPETQE